MADLVSIWNLALGHVGEATQVVDPDESTAVARACRRFWDQSRDAVLAEFPWMFARRLVTLVSYATPPDPWPYAYLAPSDLLTVLSVNPSWVDAWSAGTADYYWTDTSGYIYQGSTMGAIAPPVRWSIGGVTDEDGVETELVLSETTLSSLNYTRRVEDPTRYPAPFVDAVSFRLAWDLCIPLSGSQETRSLLWSLYQQRLGNAAALDARQRRDRGMPDAEAILARSF